MLPCATGDLLGHCCGHCRCRFCVRPDIDFPPHLNRDQNKHRFEKAHSGVNPIGLAKYVVLLFCGDVIPGGRPREPVFSSQKKQLVTNSMLRSGTPRIHAAKHFLHDHQPLKNGTTFVTACCFKSQRDVEEGTIFAAGVLWATRPRLGSLPLGLPIGPTSELLL